MKDSKSTSAKRGYTLIELIIVIVILGILAAVAIPKYLDITFEAQKAADEAVFAAVKSAAAIAFASHRARGLTMSGPGNDAYITNAATLVYYLDGQQLPDGYVYAGRTLFTPYGRRIIVEQAETNENQAVISKSADWDTPGQPN